MVSSVLVGVSTGMVSSLAVWYLLLHRAGPRLEWEADLRPYELPAGVRRGVHLSNVRRRPAIDLDIRVRLLLPGLVRDGNTEVWTILQHSRPFLDGHERVHYAVRPELLTDTNLLQFGQYLPPAVEARLRRRDDVDLKEIVDLCPGAKLELVALATDYLSGSRRLARTVISLVGLPATASEIIT